MENTTPKVRMLLTIGIVSVSLLVGVKFALESYYLEMTESYEHDLLPKTTEIEQIRAEEHDSLDKGPIPVSVAMQTLATKGRDNASPEIMPQPSDDPSPLVGWAQIKHVGPAPTLAPIPTAPPPVMMESDAGAPAPMMATDAGASPMRAPHGTRDGGAPRHAPNAADGGHR